MSNLSRADHAFLDAMLQGVSRTFALTIPQLPPSLYHVVATAYLLCRIADTIEDDPALDHKATRAFSERLIAVVEGRTSAAEFAHALAPRLSGVSLAAERRLVAETERVIRIKGRFSEQSQRRLEVCVRTMAVGMSHYQQRASLRGLDDMPDLDRYCYVVAGVVGECLSALFALEIPQLRTAQRRLQPLAVSFGQGLQMTNILKDIWADAERGVCWLPRAVFEDYGVGLEPLLSGAPSAAATGAFTTLIAIAQAHLERGLHYTLAIPAAHRGVRHFCLWALGMAVLTLRKLHKQRVVQPGKPVKISRSALRATIVFSRLFAGHDTALRWAFSRLGEGLPKLTEAQRRRYLDAGKIGELPR